MSTSRGRADDVAERHRVGRSPQVRPTDHADGAPLVPAGLDHLTPAALLTLQRSLGNRGVGRALQHSRPAPVGGVASADRPAGGRAAATVTLLRSTDTADVVAPPADEPVLEPYKGQAVGKLGRVSAPAGQYQVAKSAGVNVRARPDGTLPHIAKALYGTEVQVQALDTTGAFSFVVATTGAVGWVNKDFVALDPPDIEARLHHITEGNLTTILKNEYVDKNLWSLGTGNDYTTLAAAVVAANAGRKGVSVDWAAAEKYKDEHLLKRVLDPWMIDNFAIYHGSTILAGHNIWLPSPAYVRALQASGVIGSRPGWINLAVDVGKGLAGFLAGQVAGVFGTIWDTLTGLWELAEGIVSTVRSVLDGSLFSSISDIYDTITTMSLADVKELVEAVITMGKGAFDDFVTKWNHPDTYQQYFFKGYIVGAVALEVVLAIFTGGTTLAAKVLAKIGKYFPKLMRVLDKLLELAKKLPGRRDRDGGHDKDDRTDDDEDMSTADRAWEQARVLAALAAEEHDRHDTPVATLVPLLNSTVAARFQGVAGYRAVPTGEPHTYRIVQRARRRDEVRKKYTEGEGSPRQRTFEPPVRDHGGKAGGEIPKTGADRAKAVDSWTREELEVTAEELRESVAARQAEQIRLGEDTVGAEGQAIGAAHRVRIEDELALLRAIEKKLGR